ncbi:hypothetical protein MD484_g6297, partial [Candolleomyces efflorescens]
MPPRKRVRRTATAIMAGDFDPTPPRDVLTSLLNGVGPYKAVEIDAEEKRQRKKERKEAKRAARALAAAAAGSSSAPPNGLVPTTTTASASTAPAPTPRITIKASSFWKSKGTVEHKARPEIMIASTQRSVSVTPPPMISLQPTPECTPGPSISSATSHESLKRLYTPEDDEDIDARHVGSLSAPSLPRERKKRVAARKGWKGWVEGSPPPSEKLINLDAVPILQERRTRSGKNFDAISIGKEGWV